jgi:hypothetical protein
MALLGALGLVSGAVGSLGLASSDPVKDQERIAAINRVATDALTQGKDSRPYIQLACWAGASRTSAEYQLALAFGQVQSGQDCRIGSDYALGYAKTKFAEVQARLVGGPVLAAAGIAATGYANQVAPGSVQKVLSGAVGGIPTIVIVGAVAVVAWMVFRRK